MSNDANEKLKEFINDTVDRVWQLPTRPDLKKDCVDYVSEHWDNDLVYSDDVRKKVPLVNYIKNLVIQFLSNHCREAVSSQDIEYMAIAEKERLLTMK